MVATALLSAGATAALALAAGPAFAGPFAVGGALGTAYQWLLQQGVDSLAAPAAPFGAKAASGGDSAAASRGGLDSAGAAGAVAAAVPAWRRTLGSQPFRVLLVVAVAAAALAAGGSGRLPSSLPSGARGNAEAEQATQG